MVNRTKISKEIRRRTAGPVKTGKGTTVKKINLWKDKWEIIPGTGTSHYNPPKFRLKEKKDLPPKKKTKKPVGVGAKDVKQAASKRPPRGPRIKTIPVKTEPLGPPKGYEKARLKSSLARQRVDPKKHEEVQETLKTGRPMTAAEKRAREKLKEKTAQREAGKYSKFSKGKRVRKAAAGGLISGHNGNTYISNLYNKGE